MLGTQPFLSALIHLAALLAARLSASAAPQLQQLGPRRLRDPGQHHQAAQHVDAQPGAGCSRLLHLHRKELRV